MEYNFGGTCKECGRFTELVVTNDGPLLVALWHGIDYGHAFIGEVIRREIKPPEPASTTEERATTPSKAPRDKTPVPHAAHKKSGNGGRR